MATPQEHAVAGSMLHALAADMSSLALYAAAEIDAFMRGKPTTFAAVSTLQHEFSTPDLLAQLDANTAVAVNQAIATSSVTDLASTPAQFTVETGKILAMLTSLASHPARSLPTDNGELAQLKKLREFLIALSTSATYCEPAWDELEVQHPFRR